MAKTKVIPLRLAEDLVNIITDYAAFFGLNRSEALREIIKEGLLRKAYIGMLKRWQYKNRARNPILNAVKCDKCNGIDDLKIYHIDRNIRNTDPDNLVILCDRCIIRLENFIKKYNPKEKFAAWFFFTNGL